MSVSIFTGYNVRYWLDIAKLPNEAIFRLFEFEFIWEHEK
jgi:hypothetical protein